ncbi:MAG: hypothetical protein O7D96_08415 [SAR324 cluster bacterium]|nr:hypothetical protein [SAR324 cluster bacterium]
MRDFFIMSVSDSSALWQVRPGWGYRETRQLIKSESRTRRAGHFVYAWGTHFRASLPLTYVESALRNALHSWWQDQANLAWVRDEDSGPKTAVVRIGGERQPMRRRETAQGDFHSGTIELEGLGRTGDRIQGAPLILDHSRFGTLDTFNALI